MTRRVRRTLNSVEWAIRDNTERAQEFIRLTTPGPGERAEADPAGGLVAPRRWTMADLERYPLLPSAAQAERFGTPVDGEIGAAMDAQDRLDAANAMRARCTVAVYGIYWRALWPICRFVLFVLTERTHRRRVPRSG